VIINATSKKIKKHIAGFNALKYNKMQDMQYTEKYKILITLNEMRKREMLEFIQKLKTSYQTLSSGQKKVAKFFLDHSEEIAFMPAFEIGKKVNVSESTVIRLVQSLGYKGYAELQEIIRKNLTRGRTLSQHNEISNLNTDQTMFRRLMEEDVQNIKNTIQMIDDASFEKAVKLIIETKKIFATGSLSSFFLAQFFSHWMNVSLKNTTLVSSDEYSFYSQQTEFGSDSLLFVVIYPRYNKRTLQVVKLAKEKGSKVIAVTDSELSPVRAFADVLFICPVNSEIKIDSYSAALSLITSLMRAVTKENYEQVRKRLGEIEKVYDKFDVFFSE
jgi:DNA-binding MurR/RpiR family transcriptional regulator